MENIYKSFIAFVKKFGYTDANIWRANQNGGPMNPPCVVIAITGAGTPDSTNITKDTLNNSTHVYSHEAKRIATLSVTLDFYGEGSLDNANAAAVAFEDMVNFDIFTNNSIIPIESSEPQQLPFVGQDSLDYDRFQITCQINYNPTVIQTTDYAEEIDPEVVRVQNIQ